jgi:hypothetical protein
VEPEVIPITSLRLTSPSAITFCIYPSSATPYVCGKQRIALTILFELSPLYRGHSLPAMELF